MSHIIQYGIIGLVIGWVDVRLYRAVKLAANALFPRRRGRPRRYRRTDQRWRLHFVE